MADLTKAYGQLMDWTFLDDTGGTNYVETGELNGEGLSDALETVLHIDAGHADGSDASTNNVIVLVLIESGATDEDWHEFVRFTATGGQAQKQDLDANSGSGQANPERVNLGATANMETYGLKCFLYDTGDITNSCVVIVKGWSAGNYIENIDDLVGAYDNSDDCTNILDQWNVGLPSTVQAAKVCFLNPDGDATYGIRVRYTMVTDIE